jgi:beta-lactamase superfamily II metal-dependent hydrolase
MYQIAFGDCFLLSVRYGKSEERHVLIDFGQKGGVRRAADRPAMGKKAMMAIATDIAARVGDAGLAGIVVTHRHEDHLAGFGIDEAAGLIADLKPKVVVRSWTEDPDAPRDAGKPLADGQRFLAGLDRAMGLAEAITTRPFPKIRTVAGRELVNTAADQIPNSRAIAALRAMGDAGTPEYLSASPPGGPVVRTALADLLPGVDIDVLGPPRPEVWPQIRRQRENDPDYWLTMTQSLHAAIDLDEAVDAAGAAGGGRADGDEPIDEADQAEAAALTEAGPARYLVERLRSQQLRSVLRIVRWLDGSLNNTSVVLLFRIGDRRLLFPGDAQIENWLYVLTGHPDAERIGRDLDRVDLYKVGHHGSRNATPKRLYERWKNRQDGRPLLSVMSTLKDVYGESDGTHVPSTKLVTALKHAPMALLSTEDLPLDRLYVDVTAPAEGDAAFQVVTP